MSDVILDAELLKWIIYVVLGIVGLMLFYLVITFFLDGGIAF